MFAECSYYLNTYLLFKYLFYLLFKYLFFLLFKYLFFIHYSNTYLLFKYLFIIQILIYYSNTYFYLLFKYLFLLIIQILILFKYLFYSNTYFIQILIYSNTFYIQILIYSNTFFVLHQGENLRSIRHEKNNFSYYIREFCSNIIRKISQYYQTYKKNYFVLYQRKDSYIYIKMT